MTAVWRLDHNTEDFNAISVDDFNTIITLHDGRRHRTFPRRDGTPELATWEPRHVWYHPLNFSKDKGAANFPSWSGTTVCDAEAKQVIHDLIDDYVEFLPLLSPTIPDTEYHVINILTTLDCLDSEKTEFGYFGSFKTIEKYVFKSHCIGETPIFKLPISRVKLFVTDAFKQLVEDNNLTGLKFRKVWEG